MIRLPCRCIAIVVALLTFGQARADDDADRRAARRLKDQGVMAFERGESARALELFQEAYARFPSPNLRYNLGLVYSVQGRKEEAIGAFSAFLADAPDAPKDIRSAARKKLVELEEQTGQLQRAIEVLNQFLAERPSPDERRDTESKLRLLEAKLHSLEAKSRTPENKWRTPEAKTDSPDVPTKAARPAVASIERGSHRPSSQTRRYLGAIVLGSVGLATMAAALGTGLGALSVNDDLVRNCSGVNCNPAFAGDVRQVKRLSITTDVLLGVGGATLVAGMVMLIVERYHPKRHVSQIGMRRFDLLPGVDSRLRTCLMLIPAVGMLAGCSALFDPFRWQINWDQGLPSADGMLDGGELDDLIGSDGNLIDLSEIDLTPSDLSGDDALPGCTPPCSGATAQCVAGICLSRLLNLDSGGAAGEYSGLPSAFLNSGSDLWNGFGTGSSDYIVPSLKWADGSVSSASLHVVNLSGGFSSTGEMPSGKMYNDYIYNTSGVGTLTILNLPAGTYTLYAYGHSTGGGIENSGFFVSVHDSDAGAPVSTTLTKITSTGADTSTWQENIQYVRFSGVVLSPSQVLRVNVIKGIGANAIVNGVQIVAE